MNDFRISPEDPRLTAYALGELPVNERAAVEAALRDNPEARAYVEQTRAFIGSLQSALAHEAASEPVADVAPAPRASARKSSNVLQFPQLYFVIGGLAAACFAVVVALRTESPMTEVRHYEEVYLNPPKVTVQAPELEDAEREAAAKREQDYARAAAADAARVAAESREGTQAVAREARRSTSMPATKLPVFADATIPVPGNAAGTVSLLDTIKAVPAVPSPRAPAPGATGAVAQAGAMTFKGKASLVKTGGKPGTTFGVAESQSGTTLALGKSADMTLGAASTAAGNKPLELSAFPVSSSVAPRAAKRAERTRGNGGTVVVDGSLGSDRVALGYAGTTFGTPGEHRLPVPAPAQGFNTEAYAFQRDNAFVTPQQSPFSTFSVDVDTASYANVRRYVEGGRLPPADAVRIEELLNYFTYRYAAPADSGTPFATTFEVAQAPWAPQHQLVRIGLKARDVPAAERAPANLVFLLDVSGSMNAANKLPLVKQSMRLLVGKLQPDDRVAIVTYAGNSGLALASTPVKKAPEILQALDALEPGGSTNGSMGIRLAYDIAKANFVEGGTNRVILCTDGDFNVGVTGQGELARLVEEKARTGVALTVLGYGMGNYKDSTLELLADKGNGNYGYIDTRKEAEKLLVEQVNGTLMTVAKDVKLQVDFNPERVASYRLIGYENRVLKTEDFNNDAVDAGEIGAGHAVTALYEIVPVGVESPSAKVAPPVEPSRYAKTPAPTVDKKALAAEMKKVAELLSVRIRYKEPNGDVSRKLEFPLEERALAFEDASADFKFAAAVAAYGMILRDSPHRGTATMGDVIAWAAAAAAKSADDPGGYRGQFIDLARRTQVLLQ